MKTILTAFTLILVSVTASAGQNPRPLGSDARIRQVVYSPNEVYEIRATYGFQTTIEFSEQETIQVASIGDSIAWQVVPVGNRLFIKPVEQNPRTNLTVVTSKRTYYFNLATADAERTADMTYLVRFEYTPNLPITASNINRPKSSETNDEYKIKNGKKSGLVRAYDDGQFTYLRFVNKRDLPAIFMVGADNKESLVNYRMEGSYVVIERLARKFVFRRGGIVGEVINKKG